ncbi:MAG: hypothetical protein ABUS79_08490 [Pseudomonadota bacterium]
MRLAGCLRVEVAVACGLVAGGGALGVGAAHQLRSALLARRSPPQSSVAGPRPSALRARQDLSLEGGESAESGPDVGAESAGTFLGMSDDLLLDRIRTQPVARLKLNRGGSSLSFRVDFADGSRAAWKPAQTNTQTIPRKEVAAYRVNRLLGLNAVPPAAQRSLSRDEVFGLLHPDSLAFLPRIRAETIVGPNGMISGQGSYWIPVIKDSAFDTPAGHAEMAEWLTQTGEIPFQHRAFAAQVAIMVVFDFLIANPDRYSGGNMKTTADGGQLFFMDNTMSFFLNEDGMERNRQLLSRTQRFSRSLHQALARVDVATLRRLFHEPDGGEVLTEAEIRATVSRREFVERHVAALIAQYGEQRVLCFP